MVEIPSITYLDTGDEGGEGGRPPYRAKNGWVVISAIGREMAGKLMQIVSGSTAGADAGPINSSAGPADARRRAIEAWAIERNVEDIVATLLDAGIPVAPVRTIPEVTKDAHTWAREMLVKQPDALAGEIHVPGLAVKMSATPGRIGPVPTPGQHTDEVLSGILGYDSARLKALRGAQVIG
jgi:CoA:oxalate CoA-transferase